MRALKLVVYFLAFLIPAVLSGQETSDTTKVSSGFTSSSITGFEDDFKSDELQKAWLGHIPFRDISRLSLIQPASYYFNRGGYTSNDILWGQNAVVIEGMRVKDPSAFPYRGINRMAILTNQTAIQLGNSAAGFTLIETPAKPGALIAEAEFLTSAPFNSLGNYILDFNISAPFKFRKESRLEPQMLPSFFLGVQLTKSDDLYSSSAPHYTLTGEARDDIENTPLGVGSVGGTFIPRSDTLTASFFEEKEFADAPQKGAGIFAKVGIPILKNLELSLGSYMQLDNRREYIHEFEPFNEENYPEHITRNFDNYLRMSHAFTAGNKFQISQQFQFNFSNYFSKRQSALHEDRLFDYGYVGKFETLGTNTFQHGEENVTGYSGWVQTGYADTLVTFTRSTQNPLLANYTSTYYDLANGNTQYYSNLNDILIYGGLINGNRPRTVNDLYYNIGRPFNGYEKTQNRDIGGHYQLNFSYKVHHVKVGAEIIKSRQASYGVGPMQLWELGRQLANFHLDQFDTDNPILLIDGVQYAYNDPNAPTFGINDTILYNRLHNADAQQYFDKSLREKLGLPVDNTDIIQTDTYDPSFYSLDMFSPDELLNSGDYLANWYGYDYLGNKQTGDISYEDFFTARDANGNYTRPVKAFEPNYFAAYGEYEFNNKWVDARAGLRIDRYDANQPVLRDKYSLYKIKTAGEVSELNGNSVTHPSGIDNSAAVYVDNMNHPNIILGYREGDRWFDADGNQIGDPRPLAIGAATGRITPYLENPQAVVMRTDFDFDGTFKDYEPVVNLLPHIQIEGKPHKTTRVYFRYFAVAENPVEINRFHPTNYYFFNYFVDPSRIFYNPDLKPMRADKIVVGAKQRIYRHLYADVSYYHGIVKNSLGIERVLYAYPHDYTVFTNREKQTNQSLITSLLYQNPKSSGFHAAVHYSWQFKGAPELVHILNGYVQFNFGYGSDYIGFKTKKGRRPLEGLGLSVFANLRQGLRYTKQQNPTAEALMSNATRSILTGRLNGEQLPLFYFLDFKVEKGFSFASGKVHTSIYLWIQNLLNRKNIFDIYPYTGKPDDDGYLASEIGQQDLSSRYNPQAFADQYNMKLQNPSYLDMPRIIRWGVVFTFR